MNIISSQEAADNRRARIGQMFANRHHFPNGEKREGHSIKVMFEQIRNSISSFRKGFDVVNENIVHHNGEKIK